MIYNNLLYFLAAIFLFSIASVSTETMLPWWQAGIGMLILFFLYDRIAYRLFQNPIALRSSGYFSVEKRLSLLAILFFALTLFVCDLKNYLSWLSIRDDISLLENLGGVSVFFAFLSLMWKNGCRNYGQVFGRHHARSTFILSNIKANIPIIVPWFILTFFYDLAAQVPYPGLQEFLQSIWGDFVFLLFFLCLVVMFFPPLVRRLWGCRKIPDGPLRDHLNQFCAKQDFTAEFYFWPLFEGRVLTAGVMGILPRFRYILLTPALVENMTIQELDAVMAHEIGHVKRRHLLLYVLLIGGFSLLIGVLTEPLYFFVLSHELLYEFIARFGVSPVSLLATTLGLPVLVLALLYFRFVFGFFLRNFERQADLNVFPALGDSRSLVSAFEKIALLSGNTRDQPSWHHFGIGERVRYLEKCEQNNNWIDHHDRKVRWSLVAYVLFVVVVVAGGKQAPFGDLQPFRTGLHYLLLQEVSATDRFTLRGEYLLRLDEEKKALALFEKALALSPSNTRVMNNIAWLLLTSKELELRNPLRALTLARTAVTVKPSGVVLDTLATAYWANGFVEEALETERQAIKSDPSLAHYYQAQYKRFSEVTYNESYNDPVPEEIINLDNIKKEEGNG